MAAGVDCEPPPASLGPHFGEAQNGPFKHQQVAIQLRKSSVSSGSSASSSSGSASHLSSDGGGGGGDGGGGCNSSSSNVTAFLSKLWRMVNDNHNGDLIRWSQSGCSFVIVSQIQFAKDLLPLYFKHSNMASFIRQLNMYGFRKIPLMGANGAADQRIDVAQFYHVNFMRGQEQRLSNIKRKNNATKSHNLVVNGSFCDEVRAILTDVKSIQNSSEFILGALQVDNKSLWRDVATLRSQHHKQRRVVEKLIRFLLSLIQNRSNLVKKRKMKFLISPDELEPDLPMETSGNEPIERHGPGDNDFGSMDELGGGEGASFRDLDCGAPPTSQVGPNEAAYTGDHQQPQLFELGPTLAASPTSSTSAPVGGRPVGLHLTTGGASSSSSPLMTWCQSAATADPMRGMSEDELVPGGGTAASTTAAAQAAGGHYLARLDTCASTPTPPVNATPSPATQTTTADPSRRRLHQQPPAAGQENIQLTSGHPAGQLLQVVHQPVSQGHQALHPQHHHQLQQQHSQAGGQQPAAAESYTMMSLKFQGCGPGSLQDAGAPAGLQNQQHLQHLVANNSGQQQFQQLPCGSSPSQLLRAGSGTNASQLVQAQASSMASRLSNCQHMSQWTASSFYNSMAQQELGESGGGGYFHAAGPSGFAASGMFNELRIGSGGRFFGAAPLDHQQSGHGYSGDSTSAGISGNSAGSSSALQMVPLGRPIGSGHPSY